MGELVERSLLVRYVKDRVVSARFAASAYPAPPIFSGSRSGGEAEMCELLPGLFDFLSEPSK